MTSSKSAIYWFRNDLRLTDNPAFALACASVDYLLPIYIHDEQQDTSPYEFARVGSHRKRFLQESLCDLRSQLQQHGSDLFEISGDLTKIFLRLKAELGIARVYCESIVAPEELRQLQALRELGIEVIDLWQSSVLDPRSLPFAPEKMPDVFTQFRQQVEKQPHRFTEPVAAVKSLPPLPNQEILPHSTINHQRPNSTIAFIGGETRAQAHLRQYFERRLVDSYKQTRNQLIGMDYSSKFSPWLSLGCISARSIAKGIADYEATHGSNEGTYWLWFELLWRDYFRFLHFKYGRKLYVSSGLGNQKSYPFNQEQFERWVTGNTGEPFVDAGMCELRESGFLSNRMRQIVAGYWIYDMQGDWRAGAAWFESQLIDYDVYSNQGNWLYIAGKGTDPRGGRPFNVKKQARDHDPEGAYQRMWLNKTT